MSFNITSRVNNLSNTTTIILKDLADLQNLIGSYLRVSDAQNLYQVLANLLSIYVSNPSVNMYYSAEYINTLISNYYNKTDSDNKFALIFTVSSPLYYNTTTNKLTIDLSDFYNKSESNSKYQEIY